MATVLRTVLLSCLAIFAGCQPPAPIVDAGPVLDSGTQQDGGAGQDAGRTDAGPTDAGTCGAGVVLGADDVLTESGVIRGSVTDGIRSFKGVPFARPPVGALRWKLPQPYGCFPEQVRLANSFGAVCPQYLPDAGLAGDEDCLTLEVWAPSTATPTSARPVMVFIHGGGHEGGSASSETIDGALLAKAQGNVVVSVEYRVGPFGFLAHPALTAEGGAQKSGDYGMHDQLAALRWVKKNIAAFGGDPSKTLVFGESAGAVSVCRLVASPLAAGLFSSAVMESGACTARALDVAEQKGQAIAAQVGCADAGLSTDCLRSKTTAQLMAGFTPLTNLSSQIGDLTFDGVVDGYAVPQVPRKTLATGQFNQVPMILVTNTDELSRGVPNLNSEAQFRLAMTAMLGAKATPAVLDQIVAQYPVANYASWKAAYVAAISEATIICLSRRDALTLSQHSTAATYRAIFGDVVDHATPTLKDAGAFHGSELLWVFGTLNTTAIKPLAGADDQKTVAAMQDSWSAFAASGMPTGATVPAWPTYVSNTEQVMFFKDGATVKTDPSVAHCTFWESLAL